MKFHAHTVNGKVRILKRLNADKTSHGGFQWDLGEIKCSDWNPSPQCGGGLHGWAWGIGLGDGSDYDLFRDLFCVFEADTKDVVQIDKAWKVKAGPVVNVIFIGDFDGAWKLVAPEQSNAIRAAIELQTKGTPDNASMSTLGNSSKIAASGNYSQLAASGNYSKLAASGNYSVVMACCGSRAKVGTNGVFAIAYKNSDGSPNIAVGKVGVDGIKAHVWYQVKDGKLVEAI